MNKVPFKMIELTLGSGEKINLEDLLKSMYDRQMYSISGANYTKSTIEDVISYLKSKGGGTVVIPPTDTTNKLKIDVHKNKTGDLTVRYLYNGYRPPNSGELRPFTGDEWQAGDIMFNMDMVHSDDKCYLWYCKGSGNPGTWVQQSVWAFNADDMATYADAAIKKTLTSDVSTEVSSQLGTKLPTEVKKQLDSDLPPAVSKEVKKQVDANVPGLVQTDVANTLSSTVQSEVRKQLPDEVTSQLDASADSGYISTVIKEKVDSVVLSTSDYKGMISKAFTLTASSVVSDTTYSSYGFKNKYSISYSGCTSSFTADVIFPLYYKEPYMVETGTGTISIYLVGKPSSNMNCTLLLSYTVVSN